MRTSILIDGGHLRACARKAGKVYDNALITSFAAGCAAPDEYLFRVLYYDSPLFRGSVQLPVSGQTKTFQASDRWLLELARHERFAVRRGTLAFRGWKPKTSPIAGHVLADEDFSPVFEQKGVDMRLGLDIATMSDQRTVERIILVSGDTDMIPAMKHARKAGLEVVIAQLPPPAEPVHESLLVHADAQRSVAWP